jgi:cell division protein FtsI (penicillin-binding protein 3)
MKFLFKIKPKKYSLATFLLQIFFAVFALIIVIRLIDVQIIDSKNLKEDAKKMRQAKAFSLRGEIVDRNGIRLASDNTSYDIYAHPRYYKKTPREIASKLSPLLKISENELFKKLNRTDLSTVTLVRSIDRANIDEIRKLKIKGLDIVRKNERTYPQGKLASHILGYVNFDADIAAGVERTGEKNLKTMPDMTPIEQDGLGKVIYDYGTNPEQATLPLKGNKLILTIDSSIQHIAEVELDKIVKKTNAEKGTVIVMNPKNGEIMAFAVLPSYDPNDYKKVNPSIVKNWVLSDVYPPGSTFKIITVASALETAAITKHEKILDTGKVEIQGWPIKNYDYSKHPYPGVIDLKYLFEHSSNIGSLKIALKMPPVKFYNMLKLFGIGSLTGIDLPGESLGILPKYTDWDQVSQASMGFGYSIAATPIQMASAVASIANGGVWVTPHVIKYEGEEYEKKIKKRIVLSPQTAKDMTELLESSIRASVSKAGKIPNFTVAGKTGTSRKPNPNGKGYLAGAVYTSFAGFFPSKDPQILIMVVVDNPKGCEVWGSTVAGPVFNEVATQVTRILNMKPDAPGLNNKQQEAIR